MERASGYLWRGDEMCNCAREIVKSKDKNYHRLIFNPGFAAMSQGFFSTSLYQDTKRFTTAVHSGVERFLPSDGIDTIEEQQIGRPVSAIRSPIWRRGKRSMERQTLF